MGIRAVIVVVLALVSTVAAQNPQATKLFEEGRELAKQGKWSEACDKFSKSLELDPAPGTKLNLGECYEKQGQVRKGWLMFEEAARDFDRLNDSRAKFAHDKARDTAAKLATLVIKLPEPNHPGLKIEIGGRAAIAQAEIVERVDPGSIEVVVSASDRKPFATKVTASAGKTSVVDVPKLAELHDTAAPVDESQQAVVIDSSRRDNRKVIAYALGGAGLLAVTISMVLGYQANAEYDEAFEKNLCTKPTGGGSPVCQPEGQTKVDAAGTKADLATGVAIAGGVLLAAGVVVYVTAPKVEKRVAVTPAVTPSSVGVAIGGRF